MLHPLPVEYSSSPQVRHCVLPAASLYSPLETSHSVHCGEPSKNENLAIGQVVHWIAISFDVVPGWQLVQLGDKLRSEEREKSEERLKVRIRIIEELEEKYKN